MHDRASVAEPVDLPGPRQLYRRLKPGPGRSAREVETDQRERIQRAMIELVADIGYVKVTVRKLTRLAGVSPSAFYSHFDGKEECFVDTYVSVMARARHRVASSRYASRSREEQLTGVLKGLMRGLATDVKATRLALVEAFDGGPAALRNIRTAETSIETAVRECLDRREARIPPVAVSWITAGTMHVARARTLRGAPTRLGASINPLVRWGLTYLDEEAPDLSRRRTHGEVSAPPLEARIGPAVEHVTCRASDRDLILAATLRQIRSDGYWSLSTSQIRRETGLSATRFNRQFRDVEGCHLAAMRRLARHYFGAPRDSTPREDWIAEIHRRVSSLCQAVSADPDLAKLLFVEILTTGLSGLRCRETLISELAEAGRRMVPVPQRPPQLAAEATMAALWSTLAAELESGHGGTVHRQAATYTFFVLAPMIGIDAAAMTLEREGQREKLVRPASPRHAIAVT